MSTFVLIHGAGDVGWYWHLVEAELRRHGRLEIRGKLTDVRKAYAECHVVVCPSVRESFCRVAAEAMLNGLPVVGTDLVVDSGATALTATG